MALGQPLDTVSQGMMRGVIPFVIAVLLAFLLQPVVKFFDQRRVPHSLSCIRLTFMLNSILILLIYLLIFSHSFQPHAS